MPALLRTLLLGGGLLLLRRLPTTQQLRPAWHFWPLLLLQVASSIAMEAGWAEAGASLVADGVQADALAALLVLAAATLSAHWLGRPVLAWTLATLWLAAGLWLGWLWALAEALLWQAGLLDERSQWLLYGVMLFWWLLALRHALRQLAPERPQELHVAAALVATLLTSLPLLLIPLSGYFHSAPPYTAEAAEADPPPPWPFAQSPEALLTAQPALLQQALAQLQAEDPARVDAWLLAFGADANEDVFRNEVEYVEALFRQRFDMQGRTLALLNHPQTAASRPLASHSNLRAALAGIAQRMDVEQDLLILYLTSHGSEDHQLYVDLFGLPLDQIDPLMLKQAIDDSGIRWSVVIVSACFSGGFIDALADERTLVMTAARADRSSFGCGPDSDFSYFGRAFFINALNRSADLLEAFELARAEIDRREREEGRTPSEPQIRSAQPIGAVLARWNKNVDLGPALPFPLPESPAPAR